jgi:dynein heavy chain
LESLNSANLPFYPDEFENFIRQKCLEERELLEKTWIPKCSRIILEMKDCWKHLVPLSDDESLDNPLKFFECIATLMSNQLRNLVVDSLDEFVSFFEQYKEGNNFGADYSSFDYKRKPALTLIPYVDDPKIEFKPEFKQIERVLLSCFSIILKSAEELPRVEGELFPFPEYRKYSLRTIRSDEVLFENYVKRVLKIYESNKIGPQKYLDTYKKYADFMSHKADQDVSGFLKNSDNQLEDFVFQINKHTNIRNEIIAMLLTVPLNFYSLECNGLHESLKERVQKLKDKLIQFCVDHNRDTNKS